MRISIMQPYFFPYFLYWRMIANSDVFVIYDDVNYFKKGFINRNYISSPSGEFQPITLTLRKASQNKLINQISIADVHSFRFHKQIYHNYSNAPFFDTIFPLIVGLRDGSWNLSEYLGRSIKSLSLYLDIKADIVFSSQLPDVTKRHSSARRIIDICKHFNASYYLNLPGGKSLYCPSDFLAHGIQLSFMSEYCFAPALHDPLFSRLSILHALMHLPKGIVTDALFDGQVLI